MKHFVVIQCETGIYFSSYSYNIQHKETFTIHERINGGVVVSPTWKNDWYHAACKSIDSYEVSSHGGYKTHWELIDNSDVSHGLPNILSDEDAKETGFDDGYGIGLDSPYWKFRGFYHRVSVALPNVWKNVEYEVEERGALNIAGTEYVDMKIGLAESNGMTKNTIELSKIVRYSDLELMLVPPLALHLRPCSLSTDDMFRIVRQHVRENIDGRYARISSDYDFCFRVEKVIPIKSFVKRVEIKTASGKRYSRPRFNETLVDRKEMPIFEMTNSKQHGSYTVIAGITADSLTSMVEQVRLYLDELMAVLNAPVVECEHCAGTGHAFIRGTK